jgi:hypothetical protein
MYLSTPIELRENRGGGLMYANEKSFRELGDQGIKSVTRKSKYITNV